MFQTNRRSHFDKAGEERAYQYRQFTAMKHQLTNMGPLHPAQPENGRIYLSIIVGGGIILLMILAEMKFFGT
jgi:hypothetical protein